MIHHTGKSVFAGLPDPFEATRYHSLLVKKSTLPDCLEVTAVAGDDETEIMGLRHKEWPIHGVQFHPESILTLEGKKLLKNFLEMAR
jgi:anthranilate synthase/aminodeoxychorismate synthase-like glutamine amidotransferase